MIPKNIVLMVLGLLHAQTAAEMFVMVLDVHKWVPMPAIAARAKQSSNSAASAAGALLALSLCLPGAPHLFQTYFIIQKHKSVVLMFKIADAVKSYAFCVCFCAVIDACPLAHDRMHLFPHLYSQHCT